VLIFGMALGSCRTHKKNFEVLVFTIVPMKVLVQQNPSFKISSSYKWNG